MWRGGRGKDAGQTRDGNEKVGKTRRGCTLAHLLLCLCMPQNFAVLDYYRFSPFPVVVPGAHLSIIADHESAKLGFPLAPDGKRTLTKIPWTMANTTSRGSTTGLSNSAFVFGRSAKNHVRNANKQGTGCWLVVSKTSFVCTHKVWL